MADAIIFRRRGSGGGSGEYEPPTITGGNQSNVGNWWTAIFTQNGWFKAGQAKSNQYTVMVFGGGGAGMNYSAYWSGTGAGDVRFDWHSSGGPIMGGGGGHMARGTVTIAPNTNIAVTVGRGAINARYQDTSNLNLGNSYWERQPGGTSSFGTYLSATGGWNPDFIQFGSYSKVYDPSDPNISDWHAYGDKLYAFWATAALGGSGGGVWSGTGGAWYTWISTRGYDQYTNTDRSTYYFMNTNYGGSGGFYFRQVNMYFSINMHPNCNYRGTNCWYYPPLEMAGGGPYGGSGGIYAASGTSNVHQYSVRINANIWSGSHWIFNSMTHQWIWQSSGQDGTIRYKSTYGGIGNYAGSGTAGTSISNTGHRYPNGTYMGGTSGGGSYGGGGGGYGSQGGSYGGGGGGWCANGGWYGGGGGGYGINGYGGNNGGGGGAYGRGGGPGAGALYGGGGWGGNNENGANGIVIVQWYSN